MSNNGVPSTATSGAPNNATKDGEKAPVSSFTSYMQAKAGKTGNAYLVPADNAALVTGPAPVVQGTHNKAGYAHPHP